MVGTFRRSTYDPYIRRKRRVVEGPGELGAIREAVREAAEEAHWNIKLIAQATDGVKDGPMNFLYRLKLERHARDPLKNEGQADNSLKTVRHGEGTPKEHRMSLGDQLFRSFNIMATLAAAERIMKWYPGIQLSLDLGDRRGKEPEIESLESQYIVVAEAFNAVSTEKNAALLKCWERLLNLQRAHRYIFFHAPNERDGHREDLELMVEQKRRKRLEDQLDHESRNARTGQTGLQRAQAIERWVELVHALTPDRETISSQISWQRWDATLKDLAWEMLNRQWAADDERRDPRQSDATDKPIEIWALSKKDIL